MTILKTTQEQLQQWLSEPEGTNLEFKSARNSFHFDKLVEYCVALANEGGGKIILGVTDRRPRLVIGTAAFPEPGRTEAGLHDRLMHRIPVEEMHTAQGRVLIVHVPSRLPGMAWQIDGSFLKRAGDDLIGMSDTELRTIFAEVGSDFSAEICSGVTIADLSEKAIGEFRDRWARKVNDERRRGWSSEETLINAELLVDGKVTYAALILFGTRVALGRFLPQAEIIFEYRSSEASGPAADREEFREGFLLYQEALWEKINLRNDRQSYQDGLFRVELPTFDEISVREALLNAVAHRGYRLGGSVFVRQYQRRLEITSPGGLPPGITPENIIDQQNPRNRRLAEALSKCGLIERSGQGMNLMFESAIKQGKPLPDFTGTSEHEVKLTLRGVVEDPAFVRFMERLGEERLKSFSTYDFLTLDYVCRDKPLPEYLKSRVTGLIEVGAIESVGRGKGTRYILSQSLYSELGAHGVHTRKRGLDRETNKALLEKHLLKRGTEGSPLSELTQVLPALSESNLQRLLTELREEGRVFLKGRRRWARWYIANPKARAGNNGL